jgi:hypothetical protein
MTVRTTAVAARRAPGIVAGAALSAALLAAVARPAAAAPADAAAALVDRESDLLRQYRELERSFLRLADLLAASDPRRAALLRSVFEKAREEQVGDRLGTIVTLLEQGQLLKAGTTQAGTIEQFRALLDLLESGDGERRLVNTKKEVREYLARLAKAIARQRDIEGSTEAGGREADLSERQRALAEETRALADEIGGFAGRLDARDGSGGFKPPPEDDGVAGDDPKQPGEDPKQPGDQPGTAPAGDPAAEPAGKTPAPTEAPGGGATEAGEEEGEPAGDDDAARARRTQRRLAAAQRRMQSARERLDDARRQDARQEQQKALEELETARAELEEILRQMREQEVEQLLVQLEARVRDMLAAQRRVQAGVDAVAAAGTPGRERELEAARLGREQQQVANEAARALVLVRDDGSAVAIPQALEAVRDDATQVAARLGRGDVGGTTRGLVADIVTNLEELLAALEKASREEERRQAGPAGGRPQEPSERPLVDKLSELKMIRSLQLRVNSRTERFSQLLDDGADRAEAPELREALERLAERQRKIEQAANDIVAGRTED